MSLRDKSSRSVAAVYLEQVWRAVFHYALDADNTLVSLSLSLVRQGRQPVVDSAPKVTFQINQITKSLSGSHFQLQSLLFIIGMDSVV